MNKEIAGAQEHFMQGVSRIAHFWGFPKTMGATFGVVYLSQKPLTLDELVEQVGISKGAVSTNVRMLERLGMVYRHYQVGDRKDYYTAESDFWKIVKSILWQREKVEFDHALRSVGESLKMLQNAKPHASEKEQAAFYKERIQNMKNFFNTIDKLVATVITLDNLGTSAIQKMFGKTKG